MGPHRPHLLVDQLQPRHMTMVWRAMLRRLGDPELAEDATQDVFEQITKGYGRFDPQRGSFEGWLLGFVEFVARRAWARALALPQPRDDIADALVEDEPLPLLSPELRRAINGLPLRDRKLLILRGVEGWPAVAVGERLDMTATNVNTAFARICARLAKCLELPDVA